MSVRDEALKILEAGRKARPAYLLLLRREDSADKAAALERAMADYAAAERLVEALEDLGQRAVLRLRYLEGRRWPEVFSELERLGLYYCERHVYRIHARALRSAGERLCHCKSVPERASLESGSAGRGEINGRKQKNAGPGSGAGTAGNLEPATAGRGQDGCQLGRAGT